MDANWFARRPLAGLTAALLGLAAAGCGDSSTADNDDRPASAPQAAADPSADPSASPDPQPAPDALSAEQADAPAADPPADDAPGIRLGAKAPEFELEDQDGQPRALKQLLAERNVALVFYRSADW